MRILSIVVCAVVLPSTATAVLVVDPAQPITRQVTVQLIQTALDNGTSPATAFGNSSQRANIETSIDLIWAQAGIDINFLPSIIPYHDTFAYQGNAGSGQRPSSDLDTIFSNASSEGGILNADPLTLNLIFANVVPFFTPLMENQSAGYARVDGNGIVGYVGDTLLTFQNGLDVIAKVMAHEIGHNLGLNHTPQNGQPNLMSSGGTTQQLDASQIVEARSSSFARVFSPSLPGDYNSDGIVSAADYIVWRMTPGQTGTYETWRANYGNPDDGGGTALVNSIASDLAAVPEPSAGWLAIIVVCTAIRTLRQRSR